MNYPLTPDSSEHDQMKSNKLDRTVGQKKREEIVVIFMSLTTLQTFLPATIE